MRLSERLKIDTALTPISLNGAGTGEYFGMARHRKALFIVELGAMAAAATSVLQVMQAQDAQGTGAKVVTNNAATITANAKVAAALLTSGAVHVAGDIYTINGLVFTAAAADVPTARTYAIGADATASTANLAAKINHATLGVPGVRAAANAGVLTLTADEPGDISIDLAAGAGDVGVPSTARAVGYVECDAQFLDKVNGFCHVAIRVTNSAAMLTGAALVRGDGRYTPEQFVAAAKADVLV
jgi:ethanolamine utilization microcompartment shell protein EutS